MFGKLFEIPFYSSTHHVTRCDALLSSRVGFKCLNYLPFASCASSLVFSRYYSQDEKPEMKDKTQRRLSGTRCILCLRGFAHLVRRFSLLTTGKAAGQHSVPRLSVYKRKSTYLTVAPENVRRMIRALDTDQPVSITLGHSLDQTRLSELYIPTRRHTAIR